MDEKAAIVRHCLHLAARREMDIGAGGVWSYACLGMVCGWLQPLSFYFEVGCLVFEPPQHAGDREPHTPRGLLTSATLPVRKEGYSPVPYKGV